MDVKCNYRTKFVCEVENSDSANGYHDFLAAKEAFDVNYRLFEKVMVTIGSLKPDVSRRSDVCGCKQSFDVHLQLHAAVVVKRITFWPGHLEVSNRWMVRSLLAPDLCATLGSPVMCLSQDWVQRLFQ